MTNSMTAFAQGERGPVTWEIRSVNQRYLDVSFRMPETMRRLEMSLREALKGVLIRGKVDCSLRINTEQDNTGLTVNSGLLDTVRQLEAHVAQQTGAQGRATAMDFLRWPGVINEPEPDLDSQRELVQSVFMEALAALTEARASEGAELELIILAKLTHLGSLVGKIRTLVPEILSEHQQKMRDRLLDLNIDADQNRLEQEMVIIAHKSDVEEELDRLATHINEVRKTFAQEGTIGRRLDFLMQELNREANTLSSKSLSAATSLLAVDLKVTIEQMREQIQNIE